MPSKATNARKQNKIRISTTALLAAAVATGVVFVSAAQQPAATFGPQNPFYAPSALPFHAPAFDKIKDADYQAAIEAGTAEQLKEYDAIANDSAAPTFANTFIPLEKSGQLLERTENAFETVNAANTNPELQRIEKAEAAKLAALEDAEWLNPKLFVRVEAVYKKRDGLDAESKRLVEWTYGQFRHYGAALPEDSKKRLKQINEELSTLSTTFTQKLLAASKDGAFVTTDRSALTGFSDGQIAAAAAAGKARNVPGYVVPLQNTTQQPALQWMRNRESREALFNDSWNRAEHGGNNDTRDTIARMAQLRAEKAKLMGYPNFAAWQISNQMAKTPEAALHLLDSLVPPATARADAEAKDIQALIDSQKGGFKLAPFDWNFYSEQVRKAKYDVDDNAARPYFELNRVLEDGVFYAATKLYGITFHERKDIPVYNPDVRVFEVRDTDGKPLALFYADYFKRDNKQGGGWTHWIVGGSKLLGTLPVVQNVCNFAKPAAGQPALISEDDVRTVFHEFGHALHAFFGSVEYPSLAGHFPRDFVELPSQFNEHWMNDPDVFAHYARHYKTGEAMPAELAAKLRKARTFNQGYIFTELLAAAELDVQWHLLPADAPRQNPDTFEKAALEKTKMSIPAVPPRYRSSYFLHIWANGYAAGYYAYIWSEMLDDDAYDWFTQHGGLTRENGDRFRRMVLSRGNTQDLETMYEAWRGGPPKIDGLLRERGLVPEGTAK